MTTIYKEIEIEVSLDDLDIDEVCDLMEDEGYIVLGLGSGKQLLTYWAELYKSGKHQELLEQLRDCIQTQTGKVLP